MPATKTARSLKVLCPFCLAGEVVTIDLNDLDTINCGECDETFTVAQAVAKATELLARWEAVQTWLENAPVV